MKSPTPLTLNTRNCWWRCIVPCRRESSSDSGHGCDNTCPSRIRRPGHGRCSQHRHCHTISCRATSWAPGTGNWRKSSQASWHSSMLWYLPHPKWCLCYCGPSLSSDPLVRTETSVCSSARKWSRRADWSCSVASTVVHPRRRCCGMDRPRWW